jgi:hypothetical protein
MYVSGYELVYTRVPAGRAGRVCVRFAFARARASGRSREQIRILKWQIIRILVFILGMILGFVRFFLFYFLFQK